MADANTVQISAFTLQDMVSALRTLAGLIPKTAATFEEPPAIAAGSGRPLETGTGVAGTQPEAATGVAGTQPATGTGGAGTQPATGTGGAADPSPFAAASTAARMAYLSQKGIADTLKPAQLAALISGEGEAFRGALESLNEAAAAAKAAGKDTFKDLSSFTAPPAEAAPPAKAPSTPPVRKGFYQAFPGGPVSYYDLDNPSANMGALMGKNKMETLTLNGNPEYQKDLASKFFTPGRMMQLAGQNGTMPESTARSLLGDTYTGPMDVGAVRDAYTAAPSPGAAGAAAATGAASPGAGTPSTLTADVRDRQSKSQAQRDRIAESTRRQQFVAEQMAGEAGAPIPGYGTAARTGLARELYDQLPPPTTPQPQAGPPGPSPARNARGTAPAVSGSPSYRSVPLRPDTSGFRAQGLEMGQRRMDYARQGLPNVTSVERAKQEAIDRMKARGEALPEVTPRISAPLPSLPARGDTDRERWFKAREDEQNAALAQSTARFLQSESAYNKGQKPPGPWASTYQRSPHNPLGHLPK